MIMAMLSYFFFNMSASAQTDFSGTWILNTNESEVNDQFSLAPEKVVISQDGNNIHIIRHTTMQGQPFTIDEKFTLDGKECKNSGFQGSTKTSTVTWDDDKKSLTVNTAIEGNFGTMDTKQIYSMLNDKLKVESGFSSNQGDVNETWILEKEE